MSNEKLFEGMSAHEIISATIEANWNVDADLIASRIISVLGDAGLRIVRVRPGTFLQGDAPKKGGAQ